VYVSERFDGQAVDHAGVGAESTAGPAPESTVLSLQQEAVVAFRRHTLLPLDDCLHPINIDLSSPL
jgi:hypothetical protein